MNDDSDLDALIDSLARGERVDWERAAAGADAGSRVRALRDVARLAEFHHTLQHDAGSAAAGPVERWGDLLLLERVAAGASGEVYRAWDPTLQREVALKLAGPRDRDAPGAAEWLEEARTLARVRDPHVVAVYGAAEHDGRAGLWMEFLHGHTLEADIARRGPLPPGEVARLGVEIGRALVATHDAGALHRDVKPANIVVEADGRAVLTDFGLGQRGAAERRAQPFSGTPLFMSPQRLAGAAARATDDLYALGVTLRWALAGAPPFRAETLEQLRAEVARGPERALAAGRPDAPAALIAAIERAMHADPARRFATARELVGAFEAVPGSAGAVSPRRRSGTAVWLTAVLVVVVAAGWWALGRQPRHVTPAPPAPPPAGATAAPAVAYDVSASFVRHGSQGNVHLESGDRVSPGDEISLEFHSTRPVWVYVLDADERGGNYLLFPQPMFDRINPVPGDSTILLPGTRGGRENAWTVTSRGGREHLMVVANPAPLPELEAEVAHLPAPVPDAPIHYARVGAVTMERLRGMGGVSEVPERRPPADPARLLERIRALAGREQGVRGTWVRQVVLENPLR